jgi:hypothetical protein
VASACARCVEVGIGHFQLDAGIACGEDGVEVTLGEGFQADSHDLYVLL